MGNDEIIINYKEGYKKIKICTRSAFAAWLMYPPWDAKSEGFTNNDIDILIRNYKTGNWMLIEEKCSGALPESYQLKVFERAHDSIVDIKYLGYHLIIFSESTPDNSNHIILDNKVISRDDLIEFLRFKKSKEWYKTIMFDEGFKPGEKILCERNDTISFELADVKKPSGPVAAAEEELKELYKEFNDVEELWLAEKGKSIKGEPFDAYKLKKYKNSMDYLNRKIIILKEKIEPDSLQQFGTGSTPLPLNNDNKVLKQLSNIPNNNSRKEG